VWDRTQRLVPNPLVLAEKMPSGAILLDTASGECFELNSVGAMVWNRIEHGCSFDEISEAVAVQYGVPPDRAGADVEGLVNSLLSLGVVRPKEP
jgi:Coenzyme PQQ synthesis protein D (PqqD)